MLNLLPATRAKRALFAATVALAAAAAGGCDLQENADTDRGRDLFVENCGTCHALAEARTSSQVGPDLDAAFVASREAGMDQDTIEGVVQNQIAHPRYVDEEDPNYAEVYMPADIVTGRDAEDVSAYVATVAGVPGVEPPDLGSGSQIFTELCGTCHALAEAGTTGTTGPDLDESVPQMSRTELAEAIRDPEEEIAEGYQGGIMPPFDESQIPDENFQDLLDYLMQAASGN